MANQQLLLRNLHTFNVAAKTLSFTLTAKELFLTQGAVSHRIKTLEKELGFSLFARGTRKLELTDEGRRFHATLSQSLNAIFSEIEEITTSDLQGEITLATSPGFANGWLVPKLADFHTKFPGFNVRLLVSDEPKDLNLHDIDVAIYYGVDDMKHTHHIRLFGEKYIPICTPEYAKRLKLFEDGLENLSRINFIHSIGSDVWERWMKVQQLDVDIYRHHYTVSQLGFELAAAKASIGVAMGRYQFVKDDIESGKLVTPYPTIATSQCYDMLCIEGTQNRPKVRTFMRWLQSQLG
ncbi:LysR substrate-binding domain-containing protein [Vibrio sp. VNB-15]